MDTRVILRRSSQIRLVLLTITACTLHAQSARASENQDQPAVLSLSKASDGEYVVLRVTVRRPDDMGTMTVEQSPWASHQTAWPRTAALTGDPPWKYPCYLEYERAQRWQPPPQLDRLSFVCRCPATSSLKLSLRYPRTGGGWGQIPLDLDLSNADALTGDPSPRQRWAMAQAEWFHVIGEHAGDVGGFWTYAAEQTRRKFDLPKSQEPQRPFRWFQPPEELEYAVLSGALAIQESLQLDRMVETDRDRGERKIAFADISAVDVKSHPFDEMRAGKEPVHGKLAALVPEDHYYLRFRSVARLLEMLDFAQQWGDSLLRIVRPVGTNHGTRERILRQLCLPDNVLARLLGPAVIKEIAVSGSDPYLVNGSDVTVLFHVLTKEAFQAAVDIPFSQSKQANDKAFHDEITYQGVTIERLFDPERQVSCHRCWVGEVCMYSNSLPALKRTIDAAQGTVPSLAKAADFRYMRAAVFPLEDSAEDGFLYLSDAFIRRLVGPELRIKQKRRLEATTSLKLLTNAAMFYGYQHGPSRPTFEQLVADRSLNTEDLYDPEGGVITWDPERGIARSATYGDLGFLTPLIEIESRSATDREAQAYGRFRDRYQQYWRQYFDPIGIRIKFDKTITLQTHILPLIDSSGYNHLVDIAGGEPITFDTGQFGEKTLLRYAMHLKDGTAKAQWTMMLGAMTMTNTTSDWLGDWVTFWVEDTDAFGTLVRRYYQSVDGEEDAVGPGREALDVFNASLVLGVHCKNKLSLAAFLVALRAMINTSAPNTVIFRNLEPYHNITIVQIVPDPTSPFAEELRRGVPETNVTGKEAAPAVSERGPALYYATIEDGFYVSTQASALRNLIDRLRGLAEGGPLKSRGVNANAMLYVAPSAAELARPTVSYFLEQQARQVSWRNLAQVWLLGRCGLLEGRTLDEAATAYLGYKLVCPDGGTYRFDAATGSVVSSVHGPLEQPVRLEALPHGSPIDKLLETIELVTARIQFTEHGLESQVDIGRR